ncbi:hypothetical protein AVEN_96303-1 [Araneus ventricosus]|uniref:Uncharacterized protein n=1 Tax=Araneus ventricosus TaxID=182803 RepID=A0A4Y2R6P1_ARAVE|nr:hypothetical protein AVEN_212222-1 [Araneus ventricosus]GBO28397.1 hypothetical protein AVEN_96303-1 [Araneus ventricosus]
MATREPEMFDVLEEECRELHRCRETLEALYYTCGATEIAIEHLMRPYNPTGLDFKSVVAQIQNLKDILDRQMQLVRLLFINVQQGSENLQALKDADDPDMVDEVNRLRDLLLGFCTELRNLIKRGAITCRGFHLACKIVLDFMVEMYCKALE